MKQCLAFKLLLLSFLTAYAHGASLAVESPALAETPRRVQNVSPFTRRILRSMISSPPFPPISNPGLSLEEVPVISLGSGVNNLNTRLRIPRNYLIPYRRYRRVVPTEMSTGNFQRSGRTDIVNPTSPGDLRFLGWLFGRPNYYSRYPNYSVLEEAAGVGPYYGSSRYPSSSMVHTDSPVMIEDCTELLDPLTHEIIEDCHEVPAEVVPLY